MPPLNAIGIAASNMAESIRFYRALGLDMPDTPGEGHVEAVMPNGVRLMFDSEEIILSFLPDWKRMDGNQVSLAFECASPAEVEDDVEVEPVGELTLKGFQVPVAAFNVVSVREAASELAPA